MTNGFVPPDHSELNCLCALERSGGDYAVSLTAMMGLTRDPSDSGLASPWQGMGTPSPSRFR